MQTHNLKMEVRCRTSISGMPKVEGYLEKRGRFSLKCLWKKYWFVLDGRSLLYFKSKDSYQSLGVCKGMIDFSRVQIIRIPVKIRRGYPFEIVTRSQIIYLSANDSMTRDIWMEELQNAIRPPQISDPFNTMKVSAPHLSNLFDNVSVDPNGVSSQDLNDDSTLKIIKRTTNTELTTDDSFNSNSNVSSNITEYIDDLNKNDDISSMKATKPEHINDDSNNEVFNTTKTEIHSEHILSDNSLDILCNKEEGTDKIISIPDDEIEKNVSKHSSVTIPYTFCSNDKESIVSNTDLHEIQNINNNKQIEESDETDEYNEESNYETAEETLENEVVLKTKVERHSYKLPYPELPDSDISTYCELKNFINYFDTKESSPSINKLGKSVAVETLRNFLNETE